MSTATGPKTYLVRNGINYEVDGVEKRAEPDELVDDLPEKAIGWLLEQGHIDEPPKPKKAAAKKAAARKGS